MGPVVRLVPLYFRMILWVVAYGLERRAIRFRF